MEQFDQASRLDRLEQAVRTLLDRMNRPVTLQITTFAPELYEVLRPIPVLIRPEGEEVVASFVEEALRYDPPFRGHYRVVTRDTMLGDTDLPAGAHLVLMWPAANRDDAAYEQPDEVRLDRANPRYHLGFGWGANACIGAPLARIEARFLIEPPQGAERLASEPSFRRFESTHFRWMS